MKFLIVFILLPSLLLAHTGAQTNGRGQTSPFPLPSDCPKQCGEIDIPYPFGVGRGCFRSGFELICNKSSTPPKLIILDLVDVQSTYFISRIDNGVLYATTGITIMPSNMKNLTVSWTAADNGPFSLTVYNSLKVIGCGVAVKLTEGKKNLGQCWTSCESTESLTAANGSSCASTGCCQISIPNKLTSYVIQLTRSEDLNLLGKEYDVKAFISSDEYKFIQDDLNTSNRFNSTTRVNTILEWNIPYKKTCEDAATVSSYACVAKGSYCFEITGYGYYCSCFSGDYKVIHRNSNYRGTDYVKKFTGGAYQPNGCEGSNSSDHSITQPSLYCDTKCGNIDIPFPFGLEEGCYRNPYFALTCNTNPATLLFNYYSDENNTYQVDEILIAEGQLQVDTTKATIKARVKDLKPFFYKNESGYFDWVIDNTTCAEANMSSSYACVSDSSSCAIMNFSGIQQGYRCTCNNGYEGNPYLAHGCKDINECDHPEMNHCNGRDCKNENGGYFCCDPMIYHPLCGNSSIPSKPKNQSIVIPIGLGLSSGLFCLLVTVSLVLCRKMWYKNIQRKVRQKYFYQNRGLLLQQLISSNGDITEKTKMFQLEELEKATNNFDQNRIVGRGGHGNVFKGMLSDQRVVAIKKSKLAMKKEIDEFINEVIILSRINHRNIVKLFGCCLETEVPLLIFEFISNGTLHDHLHATDLKSTVSWEDRLRIASETAGALSYLHSAASISIFHRDVKSTNILLDEYLTTKVSDFGASRYIPIDQTQITTAVQGTFGYLDPEYHYTSQLTEKSDVYSFGVILVELLTGELPISFTRDEEARNLSVLFLRAIKEHTVFDLVELRVKEEGATDELVQFIHLAEHCLQLKGEERPTMKEVEFRLQSLRITRKQGKESKQANDSLVCETPVSHDEISIHGQEHMISSSDKQSFFTYQPSLSV